MKLLNIIIISFLSVSLSNGLIAQKRDNSIPPEKGIVIPRLSPVPSDVLGVENPVISLNGVWKVAIDNGKELPVQVPGELIMQGIDLNIGETAHYRSDFEIPKDWRNKRIFIRFDGVSSHALVKVNDKTLIEHEGSFVPFVARYNDFAME